MRFEKGYISPYFATDTERMVVLLDEPFILITDKKIALVQDLVPFFVRPAARKKIEKFAQEAGITEITADVYDQAKQKFGSN